MLEHNGVVIGTKSVRSWWLAGAALSCLAGAASAQTGGTYVNAETPMLLPPVVNLAQPNVAQVASLDPQSAFGAAFGYNLGNGFKTEIQGVTARASSEHLANLPTAGGIMATSVMLNGMYEFRGDDWHISPYVGAGFGVVDANSRVLGATSNDWVAAYQVRGGISFGFTQRLIAKFEYQWTMGPSGGRLSLDNIEVSRHSFLIGMNYTY